MKSPNLSFIVMTVESGKKENKPLTCFDRESRPECQQALKMGGKRIRKIRKKISGGEGDAEKLGKTLAESLRSGSIFLKVFHVSVSQSLGRIDDHYFHTWLPSVHKPNLRLNV